MILWVSSKGLVLRKNILIVDDLVDTRNTMKKLIEKLKQKEKVTSLKTAVLYVKPSRLFEPEYFLKNTTDWIIFPYEKYEFKRENV